VVAEGKICNPPVIPLFQTGILKKIKLLLSFVFLLSVFFTIGKCAAINLTPLVPLSTLVERGKTGERFFAGGAIAPPD